VIGWPGHHNLSLLNHNRTEPSQSEREGDIVFIFARPTDHNATVPVQAAMLCKDRGDSDPELP
jgi:hypothetical protein